MAYGFTYTLPTITGSHSDFPVLLRGDDFPSAAIDGGSSSILNGGGNLRAYTSSAKTTRLPVEVVSFVAGGTPAAEVWVKIPAAATGNTLYIEADDTETTQPAVTNTYGRNAVWSDYAAVLHLNDSSYTDSTGNGYDGTLTGSARSFVSTNHPFGGVWPDFDEDAYITLTGSAAAVDNTPVTLSCWADVDVDSAQDGLFGNRYSTNDNRWIQVQASGRAFSKNTGTENLADYPWRDPGLVYSVTTQNAAALRQYDNGSEVAADTTVDSGESIDYQFDFRVGTYYAGPPGYSYIGRVGEVRLRPSALSADWIATEYANQSASGAWGTVGSWADSGGGATTEASLTESASLSDSQSASLLVEVIAAEVSSYTDAPAAAALSSAAVIEALSLADTPDAELGAQTLNDSVADSVVLADDQVGAAIINAEATEAAALSDDQAATQESSAALAEPANLDDSQAATQEAQVDLGESVGLNDSQAAVISGAAGSLSEAVSLADSSDAVVIHATVISEPVMLAEASASTTIRLASLEEAAALADWLIANVPGGESINFVILSGEILQPGLTASIEYQPLAGDIQYPKLTGAIQ